MKLPSVIDIRTGKPLEDDLPERYGLTLDRDEMCMISISLDIAASAYKAMGFPDSAATLGALRKSILEDLKNGNGLS